MDRFALHLPIQNIGPGLDRSKRGQKMPSLELYPEAQPNALRIAGMVHPEAEKRITRIAKLQAVQPTDRRVGNVDCALLTWPLPVSARFMEDKALRESGLQAFHSARIPVVLWHLDTSKSLPEWLQHFDRVDGPYIDPRKCRPDQELQHTGEDTFGFHLLETMASGRCKDGNGWKAEYDAALRRHSTLKTRSVDVLGDTICRLAGIPERFVKWPKIGVVMATGRPDNWMFARQQYDKQEYPGPRFLVIAVNMEEAMGDIKRIHREFAGIEHYIVMRPDLSLPGIINEGMRVACNKGAEILMRQDDDDWYDSQYTLDKYLAMEQMQADLVGDVQILFHMEHDGKTYYRQNERVYAWGQHSTGGAQMARRNVWIQHPIPEGGTGEDVRWGKHIQKETKKCWRDHGQFFVYRRVVGQNHAWSDEGHVRGFLFGGNGDTVEITHEIDRPSKRYDDLAVVISMRSGVQWTMVKELIDHLPEVGKLVVVNDYLEEETFDHPTRDVEWLTFRDDEYQGKTKTLNTGIRHVLEDESIKHVYVTMQDAIPRYDAVENMYREIKSRSDVGLLSPLFYRDGYLQPYTQWPGMRSQTFYDFEYISCMGRADALRKVLPDDRMHTGWCASLEFPLRLMDEGYTIYKFTGAWVNHIGSQTSGILSGRWRNKEEYYIEGGTEIKSLVDLQYGGEFKKILDHLAEKKAKIDIEPQAYQSALMFLSNQIFQSAFNGSEIVSKATIDHHICFVFWALHQGGFETLWLRYGDYLKSKGHEVTYIYFDNERPPGVQFDGRRVVHIKTDFYGIENLAWTFKALGATATMYACHGELVIPAARQAGLKTIVEYTDGLTQCQVDIPRIPDRNGVHLLWEAPTAQKEWENHPSCEGSHQDILRNIYQPVEPMPMKRNGRTRILRVGRVVEDKGPGLFGQIARLLGPDCECIWLGGPDAGRHDLFAQMKREYPMVQWLGNRTDKAEVMGWIASADVTLMTTINDLEGISNATVESLAMGVPVVASNKGYTRDIVIDGLTGCLVNSLNPQEFVEKIHHVLDTGGWAEDCKAFVAKHHDYETQGRKLEKILCSESN